MFLTLSVQLQPGVSRIQSFGAVETQSDMADLVSESPHHFMKDLTFPTISPRIREDEEALIGPEPVNVASPGGLMLSEDVLTAGLGRTANTDSQR